jgi:hypothetical protein
MVIFKKELKLKNKIKTQLFFLSQILPFAIKNSRNKLFFQ